MGSRTDTRVDATYNALTNLTPGQLAILESLSRYDALLADIIRGAQHTKEALKERDRT